MGWGYWGAYVFISGYVTLGFGGYFHALTGFPGVVGALALIAAITAVNLTGIKVSGRIQTIIVSMTLFSLTVFGLLGLPHTNVANLSPFLPTGLSGVLQAALLAFLAFGGFDMVAAAGEEIDQPSRNLPLAILSTLGIVLVMYLFVTYVAVSVLPWQTLGSSTAPLADSAVLFLGPIGRWLVSGVALLTTAATANAILVTLSRVSFAMARDGLLPKSIDSVHPQNGTPYIAVLVSAGLLGVVALVGSIQLAARIGGLLYVSQFLLPLISLTLLRYRGEKIPALFQTPMPFVVLPIAFGACLVLLVSSGPVGILGGLGWLLIGLLIFRRRNLLQLFRHGTNPHTTE
jgi:APA family basic amino acid/polyamine antiporter